MNGGMLSVASSLTLTGPIVANAGSFAKSGLGALRYSRPDTNVLSRGGFNISQGTLVLDGGAGLPGAYLQSNIITGELWVGHNQADPGALILTNSSLSVSSWLAIDRANGSVGTASKVALYDSVLTVVNMSMGYSGGLANNSSFPVLTLAGNSLFTSSAQCFIGESVGADAKVSLSGTSRIILTGGWFAVGNAGKGSLVMSNQASVSIPGDYNLGDIQYGNGTLEMYDNTTNLANTLYVGKGADSFGVVNQWGGYVGRANAGGDWRIANNLTANGTYNLYGGIFEPVANFQIGAYGNGAWNQSGGMANCGSYPVVGRFPGSIGTMTVSGGVFNQTGTGQLLIIGEEGTGTLTVTNSGTVTSINGISIGHTATGIGVVNLDGGRLVTSRLFQNGPEGASSTFNFNGGVLVANANNATFMAGLGSANVLPRGAFVDTTNYSITIAQPLLTDGGNGGLTKFGTGTLTLTGSNAYSGLTLIDAGTLLDNGFINGAATVRAGATFGGSGVLNGLLTVESGGTVSAGAGIGTLTLNATPVLNGIVLAEVNRNGGAPLADLITLPGYPIVYGGTLLLTNAGAALQVNDTFKLFSASSYAGGFALQSATPGQIVTWDTSGLMANGTVRVAALNPVVPTTPTNIIISVAGNTLTLTWPASYTGWRLESQTNSLTVGLSSNWATVPGSASTNRMEIPITTKDGTVFYRLVYP